MILIYVLFLLLLSTKLKTND